MLNYFLDTTLPVTLCTFAANSKPSHDRMFHAGEQLVELMNESVFVKDSGELLFQLIR